jgi:hypothetical protein
MILIEETGAVHAEQFLTGLEHALNHKVDGTFTHSTKTATLVHDWIVTWVDTHTAEERRGLDILLLALATSMGYAANQKTMLMPEIR